MKKKKGFWKWLIGGLRNPDTREFLKLCGCGVGAIFGSVVGLVLASTKLWPISLLSYGVAILFILYAVYLIETLS